MAASVEVYDLTSSDVSADSGLTLGASTRPTSTATTARILMICGVINSELERLGVDPAGITSSADANLYQKIRAYVLDELSVWAWAVNQQHLAGAIDRHSNWTEFAQRLVDRGGRELGASSPDTSSSHVTETILQTMPSKLRGSDRWFD